MWELPSRDALIGLEKSDTETQAFRVLTRFAEAIGADLLSYHHIEPPGDETGSDGDDFTLMSHGFPEDWVRRYAESDYRRIDPITAYAAYQTRPVLWSDVPHRVRLTQAQQAYIEDLYSWLAPGDGLAVPVFGPSSRHGYGSIGWRGDTRPWDAVTRRALQSVFESFHLRICELRLAAMALDFELSPVQRRILRAMASGLPDALICDRTDLRADALRIEMTRIMRAMRVSDRPSILLRARALGLIG
ncbi:MAG: autoinducer binding domain-containing protein [Pseudomonadota bacterium]